MYTHTETSSALAAFQSELARVVETVSPEVAALLRATVMSALFAAALDRTPPPNHTKVQADRIRAYGECRSASWRALRELGYGTAIDDAPDAGELADFILENVPKSGALPAAWAEVERLKSDRLEMWNALAELGYVDETGKTPVGAFIRENVPKSGALPAAWNVVEARDSVLRQIAECMGGKWPVDNLAERVRDLVASDRPSPEVVEGPRGNRTLVWPVDGGWDALHFRGAVQGAAFRSEALAAASMTHSPAPSVQSLRDDLARSREECDKLKASVRCAHPNAASGEDEECPDCGAFWLVCMRCGDHWSPPTKTLTETGTTPSPASVDSATGTATEPRSVRRPLQSASES